MEEEIAPRFHHYSLTFPREQVRERFKEVRFLLVAGSLRRLRDQAEFLRSHQVPGSNCDLVTLTKPESRFGLIKLGCCLLSDHGMGPASLSIALHELFLMCRYADVLDKIILIRLGTCGGIGVDPGTICVTNRCLDPLFQDFIELKICGKRVTRPCVVNQKIVDKYEMVAMRAMDRDHQLTEEQRQLGHFLVVTGSTIATNDFYEEQGRTNGAICDHTEADKMNFLRRAKRDFDVINMEMESNYLAAMSHKCGVSFVIACVALNNRLEADTMTLNPEQTALFERRLFWLNMEFISDCLNPVELCDPVT